MIYINEEKKIFHLYSPDFSYYLTVHDGQLLNLYYGSPLAASNAEAEKVDLSYVLAAYPSGASFELPPQRLDSEAFASPAAVRADAF